MKNKNKKMVKVTLNKKDLVIEKTEVKDLGGIKVTVNYIK